MKKAVISFVLSTLLIGTAYAGDNHALGRPLRQQNHQNRHEQRPILTDEERAFVEKEAYAFRLLNKLSQPTPEDMAEQTLTQQRAILQANANLYPQRREEAHREAELAREINRSNRLENLWWAITENSLIKLVAFGTVKATSFVTRWWYADKIAAKKKGEAEAVKMQAHAQAQAIMLQRVRENQQLQLTQTQILAAQQQLLNNFVTTTDDDKHLHTALKTKFRTELSHHFGIKPAQQELADASAPQAYMVLPPAKAARTAATLSAPAAA